MNKDLLKQQLVAVDNPGLDTFDPRLMDIVAFVENGEYQEAASQSEGLIQEQVYDIRIMSYYLYGTFLEQGVSALPSIVADLIFLLDENIEAIGPARNREKTVQSSLKWFMAQMVKKLEYEEKKNGGIWQQWLQATGDDVDEALDALSKLKRVLGRTLEDLAAQVTDPIGKIQAWLTPFHQLVYKEPEPEVEVEEVVESFDAFGEEQFSSEPEVYESFSPEQASADPVVEVAGSYQMQQMSRKLEIFQQLIKRQKFMQAAIVADDINSLIETFTPRIFLPTLFSKYMQHYAMNVERMVETAPLQETMEWESLRELYHTDLDHFLSFANPVNFSTPNDTYAGEVANNFTEQPVADSFGTAPEPAVPSEPDTDSGGFGDSSGGFGDNSGGFGDSSGGFDDNSGGFGDSSGGFDGGGGGFGDNSDGGF